MYLELLSALLAHIIDWPPSLHASPVEQIVSTNCSSSIVRKFLRFLCWYGHSTEIEVNSTWRNEQWYIFICILYNHTLCYDLWNHTYVMWSKKEHNRIIGINEWYKLDHVIIEMMARKQQD